VLLPLAVVLMLLADGPVPSTARPAPSRPELSWSAADALAKKLVLVEQRVKQRVSARQTVQVTEGELNSYLNLTYASQMPRGLTDVDVRFGHDRVQARGWVDLDQLQGKVQTPTWSPLSFLGGRVPVDLAGRFVNQDGFGSIEWESIYVSSIRVPIRVLEQMVASATRNDRNPEGFDIHAPFRLPYSVNRVRLEPGKAFLDF
jgi:hypothetical protein